MASVCPDETNSQPARNARKRPGQRDRQQPMTVTTKTPRCTKAEKARRVAMVLRWLAQGCGLAEIVRHAAREWRERRRHCQNYLAAASAMHASPTCAADLTATGAPATKQARHRRPATIKRNLPNKP